MSGQEAREIDAERAAGLAASESALKPRRPRGFAAMDPAKVSEISRLGGRAAHRAGTAHEFTSEEAKIAGRKGGAAKRRAPAKEPA